LLLCVVGAFVGTVIGVLPGIGPPATVALLLPLTFALDPAGAIVMLAAIYYGAQYGSSTTAILINLPGEVVDEAIDLYDDGDRTTLDYEGGVLRSRLVEDLDNSESWTTQTNTFDATGALTDTVFT
jgi:putative tricarboxylic transport membrane protein